jgi:myo-inositol-1(or 4)-monophosphatase
VSSRTIDDALLCLQLPYDSESYGPIAKHLLDTFYGKAASIRMLGSAAIALCYVAAGRLDAYVEKYIGQWDFMAGALIVQEAGGCITDYDGNADFTQGNSVVATNGLIHQEMLQAVSFRL